MPAPDPPMTNTLVLRLCLWAVHPHLEMLGQNEVLFGIFRVPVSLGDPVHVAPPGGTVLRTPAVMLAVGGCGKGDNRISPA